MLLTITTTYQPATDLGFLLHKHPNKFQSIDLSIGKAHIFYPEVSETKTGIALLLDIDPIDLVRGTRKMNKGFTLGQYVNDRPYVASSFMSVALSKAFSTAMNGKSKDRPELVNVKIPLEVKIAVLAAPKGGEKLIRSLFEPLGYQVNLERHTLDEKFPNWGMSKYFTLQLKHQVTTQDLLSHLYVLLPVLDNDKHYFVSENEIQKLLAKGKSWLINHPEKEQITKRYLLNLGTLTKKALLRLNDEEDFEIEHQEKSIEEKKRKETLHQKRLKLVLEQTEKTGAETILDLGCGEGKLLRMLLKKKQFKKIVGMDISYQELTKAKERLYWDEMSPKQKERIHLFQGALTYRDKRLEGYDLATVVEVIEHIDLNRLQDFERVLFEFAKPTYVILTTPNAEYNALFESMEKSQMRHDDHRFEWTRTEFENWGKAVAEKNDYQVEFLPIGEVDENYGSPSQMAIFKLD